DRGEGWTKTVGGPNARGVKWKSSPRSRDHADADRSDHTGAVPRPRPARRPALRPRPAQPRPAAHRRQQPYPRPGRTGDAGRAADRGGAGAAGRDDRPRPPEGVAEAEAGRQTGTGSQGRKTRGEVGGRRDPVPSTPESEAHPPAVPSHPLRGGSPAVAHLVPTLLGSLWWTPKDPGRIGT